MLPGTVAHDTKKTYAFAYNVELNHQNGLKYKLKILTNGANEPKL